MVGIPGRSIYPCASTFQLQMSCTTSTALLPYQPYFIISSVTWFSRDDVTFTVLIIFWSSLPTKAFCAQYSTNSLTCRTSPLNRYSTIFKCVFTSSLYQRPVHVFLPVRPVENVCFRSASIISQTNDLSTVSVSTSAPWVSIQKPIYQRHANPIAGQPLPLHAIILPINCKLLALLLHLLMLMPLKSFGLALLSRGS